VEPAESVIREGKAIEAFATHQWDFTPIRIQYDLDRVKCDSSNCKCLMVIKCYIVEAIRGAIPPCETAKEYLKKMESKFTGSSKIVSHHHH
jgi:hypothetical protein